MAENKTGQHEVSQQVSQEPAESDVRPTMEGLRRQRDEVLRIAQTHGAHNVRVFGSVARGEARPDSDIDFLVDLEPDRTLFDLSGLIVDLEEALGREVHVVEIAEPSRAAHRIAQEAVPL